MTQYTKTPKLPLKPRRCKYCRATFVPQRAQDKDAKFCEPNHRKAYWRYGGLPFHKMREQIMREVRKIIAAEFDARWNRAEKLIKLNLSAAMKAAQHAE